MSSINPLKLTSTLLTIDKGVTNEFWPVFVVKERGGKQSRGEAGECAVA
jgi:hypothetical protein